MLQRITRIARTAVAAARAVLRELGAAVGRLWQTHQDLLRNNAAYGAAIAAGLAAIAGQTSLLDILSAVGATLLAIYAATRRTVARY